MKLNQEQMILFAVFAALFTVIAGSKTNSPPDRAIRRLVSKLLPSPSMVSEDYPFGRDVWPFDAATSNAISGKASTKVVPIPDEMVDTGISLYRIARNIETPVFGEVTQDISDWRTYDADNRGLRADLPFEFVFNGKNYSELTILSNGRLAFGYATHHRRPPTGLPLEFDGELEIAAPFWGNHLVAREDNSSVCSVATDNDFTVVWQDLSTPSACVNSNTTVVCRLDSSGNLSWYYSPVAAPVVSNVTIGIQSGTNGWNLVNGGSPQDIAALLSSSLRVDLVPAGGVEWAVADNDGDSLTNFEEFMLGTNPNVADTDGDGPDDKWELVHGYPPDIPSLPPMLTDTDGDGVSDRWEMIIGTDPNESTTYWPCSDTDGDGFVDYYENEYLYSDALDWTDPPGTNTYDEAVLICEIESSLPCLLVVESTDRTICIPWIPDISPSEQKVYVPSGERVAVYLSRDYTEYPEFASILAGCGNTNDVNSGYWYSTLNLYDGLSWNSPSETDGTFGPLWAQSISTTGSGWIASGVGISSGRVLEYWRLMIFDSVIDYCGQLANACLYLDSSSFYQDPVYWFSDPGGFLGTGNPLWLHPSEWSSGQYTVYVSTDTNGMFVVASTTVNIRRLSVVATNSAGVATSVINVDATDTTTHTIELSDDSYSPDGYTVYSEPPGINGLSFVPSELQPGVAYHVYIWNGICGHAEVTVNNLTLVSQTKAEWPENRDRTDIGVGEEVSLEIRPFGGACAWSCQGSVFLSQNIGTFADVKATDAQGDGIVSATIDGITISKRFSVLEPTGYCFAEAYSIGNNNEFYGMAGAQAYIDVYIAPTNVNFKQVWIEEGYASPTNMTGWFLLPNNAVAHDVEHGACHAIQIENRNYFTDFVAMKYSVDGWADGSMTWNIPVNWWIEPEYGGTTNVHSFLSLWDQDFFITRNGDCTILKFGVGVSRSVNNNETFYRYGR